MLQNTPSCAIDKKSAWGVCSNTPKYSVHNNTLSIIFLYKNEYFYNFVFTKILTKYSPKRTKLHHFFNLLGGAYPRTPIACNTIHNHANTPTFPKYFEPPPPPPRKKILDMPLKKGLG